jgi:hypothetical protein
MSYFEELENRANYHGFELTSDEDRDFILEDDSGCICFNNLQEIKCYFDGLESNKEQMSGMSKRIISDKKAYEIIAENKVLVKENAELKNFLAVVEYSIQTGEYWAEFPHSTNTAYGVDIVECFNEFKKIYRKEGK